MHESFTGLDSATWSRTPAGAVMIYDEGGPNEGMNLATYGRSWNWYAVVDVRGLCPMSWYVPQDSEFKTLEMELGMSESEANGTG